MTEEIRGAKPKEELLSGAWLRRGNGKFCGSMPGSKKRKAKPKTPKQIHKELQSWDKLMGRKDYDQGYVLGFRMALKWALGIEPPRTRSQPEDPEHKGIRQTRRR